jgi:hypothetical protein
MYPKKMNAYILNRASKHSGDLIHYDDIAKLNDPSRVWKKLFVEHDKYFFFNSETMDSDPTTRRHCIPRRKKFLDYIAKKEYLTLQEWAEDNGKTLDDICYGRLGAIPYDDDKQFPSTTLEKLIKFLNPSKWENKKPDTSILERVEKILAEVQELRNAVLVESQN